MVMMERSRYVIKKGVGQKKVISHDELMNRLRKTFYYGSSTIDNYNANDNDNDDDDIFDYYDDYDDFELLSRPLAEYASDLFSEPHKGHSLNRLNIVKAGSINASPCTLIMALIYLERINSNDPNYVRRITPTELFIVSMIISTKFYSDYDEEIHLSEWAEKGDISCERLKELEMEFLYAIDWNIYISNEEFFNKIETIEKFISEREGIRRGWLTYTELFNLLPSIRIVKLLLNNIIIIAVSYAASVITISCAFCIYSHIPGNVLLQQTNNPSNNYLYNNEMNTILSSSLSSSSSSSASTISSTILTNTTNTTNTSIDSTKIIENNKFITLDTLNLLCKNYDANTDSSIIDYNNNVNESCQATRIEDELKILLNQNGQYTTTTTTTTTATTATTTSKTNQNYYDYDYDNDDDINDYSNNDLEKCYYNNNNNCDNNHFMNVIHIKDQTNNNNNNNWKNKNLNYYNSYQITESIMNHTKSLISYLIKDDGKSLIKLIQFNWFKFI